MKIKIVSSFGLVSSLFFIIFSFLGRVLFPFGDEPDFTVRAPRVIFGEHPWWSPYSIFHDLLANLEVVSTCSIEASATSMWMSIGTNCTENIEQIIVRFILTILVAFPLLYAITMRKSFVTMMYFLNFKLSAKEWNYRLDALSLSILIPSMIYYFGIFAEEQFTLVLSLFIFLFWGSWILTTFIFSLVMYIDLGNSIVLLTFILFGLFFTFISKKINIKVSITLMLSIVFIAFILGFSFLTYLENISLLASKAEAMYNKGLGFENKYPVILRPVVTYMTGVFMTPSGVKMIFLYLVYTPVLLWVFYKIHIYNKHVKSHEFQNSYTLLLVVFTTILFFVFLFPDYAFAKYYVFMIPFLFVPLLGILKKNNILKFLILSNLIVFLHLILYRINF